MDPPRAPPAIGGQIREREVRFGSGERFGLVSLAPPPPWIPAEIDIGVQEVQARGPSCREAGHRPEGRHIGLVVETTGFSANDPTDKTPEVTIEAGTESRAGWEARRTSGTVWTRGTTAASHDAVR